MKSNFVTMEAGSSARGIYEAKVLEPVFLPRLRRKAFKMAGLSGDYDGSESAYRNLPSESASAHDRFLSNLVKKSTRKLSPNARKLMRQKSREVFTTGRKNNLILDQGLDKLLRGSGTINWANFSTYCAVGTGTTPTQTDSGTITATTSGLSTTITASGSFFTADMVGQLIRFDSGEERYIASQTGTECVVTVAVNIAAPTLFTVWAVNQTGLASESKRTNTYLTGTGNCGRTQAGATFTYRRTYDFTAEVSNQNYTELGWSDLGAVAANLNSRALISGGTVSVLIGQQLRVIYDLSVTVSPSVSTPGVWNITGWPVSPATVLDGDYILANPAGGIFGMPDLSTTGVPTGGAWPYQRSGTLQHQLGTGSTMPSFGSSYSEGTSATANTNSFLTYTDGNFYLDAQSVFNLNTGNGTTWRSLFTSTGSGLIFIFDEAQTKANTHTLTVRSRMSVGRTLVNP